MMQPVQIYRRPIQMKPGFCRLSQLQTLPRKIHSVAFKSNHILPHEYVPKPEHSHFSRNAFQVFDTIPDLDVVSATTIIGQFARLHQYREAIQLFSRMLFLNVTPNEFTFGTVIHSSTSLGDLNLGRQFQACAMKMGLNYMVFVGSAVLDSYSTWVLFKKLKELLRTYNILMLFLTRH